MNAIVKYLIIIASAVAVLTLISNVIPEVITENLSGAFTYFLTTINNLSSILPVDTIFTCIKALSGFFFILALYYSIKTVFHWVR